MKRGLLSTSSLVAVGLAVSAAAPARAAEAIKLSLGGYYHAYFSLRAQSDRFEPLHREGRRNPERDFAMFLRIGR